MFVLGGLIYVPLCLFEVRMSPQLHNMVYGFAQHSFGQTVRGGGWRPMVFMQHGLAVGLFMSVMLPWAPKLMPVLLEYDGNRGTIVPSSKLEYMPRTCAHFADDTDLGDPFWKITKENNYGTK